MSVLDVALQDLSAKGLNVHGFLAFKDWPVALQSYSASVMEAVGSDPVLWVVAHQGPALWRHLTGVWGAERPPIDQTDPIDRWAFEQVSAVLRDVGVNHKIVFPMADRHAPHWPLQQLGRTLGWHHTSPFQVGIDAQWGSWFAYRAVVVLPSGCAPPSASRQLPHPCETCVGRPCEVTCPAQALTPQWSLDACMAYRLSEGAACAATCVAREACPVGSEHRYGKAQLAYHYGQSLAFIRPWKAASGDAPSPQD